MEGRSATLLDLGALLSGLLDTLGDESLVLGLSLLGVLSTTLLEGQDVTLALENNGGDKTLDLGGLGVGLLLGVLGLDLATDNELADIIILGQVLLSHDQATTKGLYQKGRLIRDRITKVGPTECKITKRDRPNCV